MKPATLNLACTQGDDFEYTLEFVTRNEDDTTDPLDVSDWACAGDIKASTDEDEAAASFAFDMADAATGTIRFSAAAADTAELEAGTFVYDIQRTLDGKIRTFLKGRFKVDAQVTE